MEDSLIVPEDKNKRNREKKSCLLSENYHKGTRLENGESGSALTKKFLDKGEGGGGLQQMAAI